MPSGRTYGAENQLRYRKRHPEKTKEKSKRWFENNPEKLKEYGKRYYAKHKDDPEKIKRRKEAIKRYLVRHREEIRKKGKVERLKNRIIVIQEYGGQCACCKEKQIEFLCIDHINGGGSKHRRSIPGGHFYPWLIKNDFPSGFQVLCSNCNQAKHTYNQCPHTIQLDNI